MLKFIREYFGLSNSEQKGLIALIVIIFLTLGVSRISASLFIKDEVIEDNSKILAAFYAKEDTTNLAPQSEEVLSSSLFNFNPNTASKEDFIRLGFSESIANTIMNYRIKGGKFYQKEDLLKIYGVTNALYEQVESYILIANEENKVYQEFKVSNYSKTASETKKIRININTADSASLTQIKGIGKVFASRIVKYRNILGGFYSTRQLMEVYGITEELYSSISEQVYTEGDLIKLNINEANWYELKTHPYIDSETANKILAYKKKNTRIDTLESLLNQSILDTLAYNKLEPYLKLEE